MAKINFLSEELCNRIAAGEVIDRPYSAVKELIENSIDAGATEIEIRIERGGKDLIEVTDNGCGIEAEDMRAAFMPHATSKICTLSDIDHIRTLGFRGEALASISSIACVELISAVEGKEGNKVECDGEFIGKVQPAATSAKGTRISIRKLFFNTPVRFKFMKSDKKEEADITSFVTHYILGYSNIAFKYYSDGKLVLQSYGGGLEEAIAQVYGANVLQNCFKISAVRNDIKISGFISNQNFFKSNKTYQNTYLNGRHVVNSVISGAVTNAYSAYAMKRQYPFYVLFVETDEEFVDVNVHPNKSDVRFVDNSLIYGSIYKIISSILDGTASAAEFVVDSDDKNSSENADKNVNKNADNVGEDIDGASGSNNKDIKTFEVKNAPYAAEFIQTEKIYDRDFSGVVGIEQYEKKKKSNDASKPAEKSVYEDYEAPSFDYKPTDHVKYANDNVQDELTFCSGSKLDFADTYALKQIDEEKKAEQTKILFGQCKYRGTLFNTYIIYELRDEVYMIDQHAAHERLIYDELKKKLNTKSLNRQCLLVPYMFAVTPEEQRFIEENMDTIWQMGFMVEPFGNRAYRVNELPADLPDLNPKEFFDELLANVGELKNITLVDILKDKIAQTACKHAVKGGDVLTDGERDKLFEMLQGNMGLKCPHGRPICVKMTKTEIEKMFKRKV